MLRSCTLASNVVETVCNLATNVVETVGITAASASPSAKNNENRSFYACGLLSGYHSGYCLASARFLESACALQWGWLAMILILISFSFFLSFFLFVRSRACRAAVTRQRLLDFLGELYFCSLAWCLSLLITLDDNFFWVITCGLAVTECSFETIRAYQCCVGLMQN